MASFITGLPLIVDAGTNAMVSLNLKKDRMNMKVGSKLFNLGFIQKQLAKQLEPLKEESKNNQTEEKTNKDKTLKEEPKKEENDTEIL